MEIWSWAVVDRAAAPEMREKIRFASIYRFSPTGVFEQDDMDNWVQVTGAARSVIAKRVPANYQMNLSQKLWKHPELKGWIGTIWSDSNQLDLFWRWATLLEAEKWDEVHASPSFADLAAREEIARRG